MMSNWFSWYHFKARNHVFFIRQWDVLDVFRRISIKHTVFNYMFLLDYDEESAFSEFCDGWGKRICSAWRLEQNIRIVEYKRRKEICCLKRDRSGFSSKENWQNDWPNQNDRVAELTFPKCPSYERMTAVRQVDLGIVVSLRL